MDIDERIVELMVTLGLLAVGVVSFLFFAIVWRLS